MVLQTVDVAGFWRFGICDAVSIFLPAVSRLFPIFPIYVAFCLWFISSRISLALGDGVEVVFHVFGVGNFEEVETAA